MADDKKKILDGKQKTGFPWKIAFFISLGVVVVLLCVVAHLVVTRKGKIGLQYPYQRDFNTLICNNISINDTHEITGCLGDCSTTTETQATANATKRPDYSTTNSSDVIENVTTNANTGKSERGYW